MIQLEKKLDIIYFYNCPPPLNGSALACEDFFLRTNSYFNSHERIDSKLYESNDSINILSLKKLFKWIAIMGQLFNKRKSNYHYLAINLNLIGLLKLCFILPIIYRHTKRILIHPHTQIKIPKLFGFLLNNFSKISVLSISYNFHRKNPDTTIYFPNYAPLESFKKHLKNYEKLRIVIISNLYKFKGILELIELGLRLKHKNIDFQIKIVGGDGDLKKADLSRLVLSKGLENEIQIVGAIHDQQKKEEILKESNLAVYPTKKDFMPLFLLESMAFGLTAISYDVGEIASLINHNNTGYVVNSLDEITERCIHLSRNKELHKKLGHNSFLRYSQKFSKTQYQTRLMQLIKNVKAA